VGLVYERHKKRAVRLLFLCRFRFRFWVDLVEGVELMCFVTIFFFAYIYLFFRCDFCVERRGDNG